MHEPRDIEAIIRGGSAIDDAIAAARRRVIERHRQLHVPLVIWREGHVVEVPPDAAPLPEVQHAATPGAR